MAACLYLRSALKIIETNIGKDEEMNYAEIDKELKEEKFKCLFLCLIAVLLLFGINCIPEFATDTYSGIYYPVWKVMLNNNGRLISTLILFIFEEWFCLPFTTAYIFSYVSAIVFLTFSLYFLADIVIEYCKSLFYSVFVSVILIANFFSIEYFLFIEKGLFMLGILLAVLAFKFTRKFFEEKRLRDIIIVEILLLLTVNIYQIFLALYVILCLPVLLRYIENFYKFLIYNIIVMMMYALNMGVAYIVVKFLLHSNRADISITNNIFDVFQYIVKIFFCSGNTVPKYLLALMTLGAIIMNILNIRRKVDILSIIYLVLGVTIVAFFPYFVGITNDYSPRCMYPFASIAGILVLNVHLNLKTGINIYNKMMKLLIAYLGVSIFAIQIYSFNGIFIDRYQTNQMDKYICSMIINKIEEYQLENNIEITTISIYEDKYKTWSYTDSNRRGLSVRAFATNWSDINAIKYYSGKQYIRGKQDENLKKYFSSRDWKTFSDEQLVFENETLHFCIY